MPAGRPTIKNPEIVEGILRKLKEGASFLWFDSAENTTYPATATIRRWRLDDEEFDAQCARACESHAEAEYDRMQEIERRTLLKASDPDYLDPKAVNVVLSNMRWRMEKRKPRTFGQKIEVAAQVTLEQLIIASLPPKEPQL